MTRRVGVYAAACRDMTHLNVSVCVCMCLYVCGMIISSNAAEAAGNQESALKAFVCMT